VDSAISGIVFVRVYFIGGRQGMVLNPDAVLDRKVPYQEKHVVQQASIVGNMEAFGLLQGCSTGRIDGEDASARAQAVVEFGAGRGYLTQVLADCYGITNVFLVERRSYKLKVSQSVTPG
jgi:tRNA:m4X modification enzyme